MKLNSDIGRNRARPAPSWPLRFLRLALAGACLLSGCAVGPDFRRPAPPSAPGYTREPLAAQTAAAEVAGGTAQRFIQGLDIPGQWWSLFHSESLNELVERALKANPTVQSAEAALRVAQENILAQRGAYYPSVQANYTANRQKSAAVLSPPLSSGSSLFNLHTAQLNITYLPDVFGGTRRQVEALGAQAEAQRFELEAAHLTLTSNVVLAAVQESTLRGQIAATEALVGIQTEQLELLRRQAALGAIAEAAVVAQETALAQAEAVLPPLRKQLAQQRDLLIALVGGLPHEQLPQAFTLNDLKLPAELPVSLPSQLVEQRPDVRSAEAQLHAASAQIGVATANMLPQLSLTAAWGGTATRVADLFSSGNVFWSLAAGLAQPVFEGGTLLHRKRAAEAAYEQALAQYRGVVIGAFQNVADALYALQFDAEALAAAARAERASEESLGIARRQLELGDVSYLALLSAQQAYQQALINRVQAQASRYSDTVALFQALGGGWWNRTSETSGVAAQPAGAGGEKAPH